MDILHFKKIDKKYINNTSIDKLETIKKLNK